MCIQISYLFWYNEKANKTYIEVLHVKLFAISMINVEERYYWLRTLVKWKEMVVKKYKNHLLSLVNKLHKYTAQRLKGHQWVTERRGSEGTIAHVMSWYRAQCLSSPMWSQISPGYGCSKQKGRVWPNPPNPLLDTRIVTASNTGKFLMP